MTGRTRGIGAAIAATLARRGANVAISARAPADELPDGVRVNTVSPGMTRTSAVEGVLATLAAAQDTDVENVLEMLITQMGGASHSGAHAGVSRSGASPSARSRAAT